MDETIVYNWNRKVPIRNSVTYILGDVSFASMERTLSLLERLNGDKILVTGNHDESYLNNVNFRNRFKEIHPYKEIHAAGTRVCLFHFPIWEWNHMHKGAIHFHGHLHGGEHGVEGRILDVGMDGNNMEVYDLDKLAIKMLELPVRTHHGRKTEGV